MRARDIRRAQRVVWKMAGREPVRLGNADTMPVQPEPRLTAKETAVLRLLGVVLVVVWGLLLGAAVLYWGLL
jgi:hypothetical protein